MTKCVFVMPGGMLCDKAADHVRHTSTVANSVAWMHPYTPPAETGRTDICPHGTIPSKSCYTCANNPKETECARGWVACEANPCPRHVEYWRLYKSQTPPEPAETKAGPLVQTLLDAEKRVDAWPEWKKPPELREPAAPVSYGTCDLSKAAHSLNEFATHACENWKSIEVAPVSPEPECDCPCHYGQYGCCTHCSATPPRESQPVSAMTDVEPISAKVHEQWMESKRAQGVQSRKSESGEELMVPYEQLSEAAKELDRGSVRAVLNAMEDKR